MFGGGFPFNFSRGGEEDDIDQFENQEVDSTQYYDILQVEKNATQDEIKSAYQRLSKVYDPDQENGDPEKLQKIREAYETLEDPQRRELYDHYGKNPEQAERGEEDLLNMFLGRQGKPQKAKVPQVQPTQKLLKVTLQNIYNGQMLKINHTRTRCCESCNGKGGQNVERCDDCNGRGFAVKMFQMGPGMYQQVQQSCEKCQGQGQTIGEGGKCKVCEGKKILEKEKLIEVIIEKGIPNKFPIKISGEGNEIPDALTGDLIFVTQQEPHDVFIRKGADLFMKQKISLAQALTGVQFQITHLDGTLFIISSDVGEVLGDGDKKVVRGLGMPYHKNPMQYGNLIVQFNVIMPKRGELSESKLETLISVLPGEINHRPENDDYEMLDDFDPQNLNSNEEGGRKKDEEEQEYQQGATCGTQ